MTKRIINTQKDLDALQSEIMEKLLIAVSKDILSDFLEFVKDYAYADNPVMYRSGGPETGEFYQSWTWSDVEKKMGEMVITMFSDKTKLSKGNRESPYRHSSIVPSWPEDTVDELERYLDRTPISSHWITGDRPGGYWKVFNKEYIDGGKLDALISKHARRLGLKVYASAN